MTPQDPTLRLRLESRAKGGAHWFYWIAALSFVTSIISLTGSHWGFFVSLGVTQLVDAVANGLAPKAGGAAKVVALVFDAVAAGLFALVGYFAAKRHPWAFVVGMALYLLDALVFVLVGHWLGLAFHAFVLYSIFGGYKACTALAALERETAAAGAAPAREAAGV